MALLQQRAHLRRELLALLQLNSQRAQVVGRVLAVEVMELPIVILICGLLLQHLAQHLRHLLLCLRALAPPAPQLLEALGLLQELLARVGLAHHLGGVHETQDGQLKLVLVHGGVGHGLPQVDEADLVTGRGHFIFHRVPLHRRLNGLRDNVHVWLDDVRLQHRGHPDVQQNPAVRLLHNALVDHDDCVVRKHLRENVQGLLERVAILLHHLGAEGAFGLAQQHVPIELLHILGCLNVQGVQLEDLGLWHILEDGVAPAVPVHGHDQLCWLAPQLIEHGLGPAKAVDLLDHVPRLHGEAHLVSVQLKELLLVVPDVCRGARDYLLDLQQLHGGICRRHNQPFVALHTDLHAQPPLRAQQVPGPRAQCHWNGGARHNLCGASEAGALLPVIVFGIQAKHCIAHFGRGGDGYSPRELGEGGPAVVCEHGHTRGIGPAVAQALRHVDSAQLRLGHCNVCAL
mmetsp:Transcript_100749/g.240140  ORF Transcript_100749/g.240140 Transcript_100749/m.240140 type:complete len:458 (+) Transcript_100749:1853-3226(+)